MLEVYIGLGGNLGKPMATLLAALEDMKLIDEYQEIARSGCWLSAPLGGPPQPDYCNAVVKASYAGSACDLLTHLQAIECRHKRRRGLKNGPRTLDLDILLFGNQIINSPELTVPHPRVSERAFVLLPLKQLDAKLMVPGLALSVAQLCRALPAGQRIKEIPWATSGEY